MSRDTPLTGRVNLRVNLRNLKMTLLTGTLSNILLTVVPKLKCFVFLLDCAVFKNYKMTTLSADRRNINITKRVGAQTLQATMQLA